VTSWDVVVVGAGNAALCAALSARENGARVLVLERAPQTERGGNTAYTAGAMRFVYEGIDDVLQLVPELSEQDRAMTDFGAYPAAQFFDDMDRVTQSRSDPDLVEVLVNRSFPTLRWMRSKGVRFAPSYGRQAYKFEGKFTFWGGLAVEVNGGGLGLIEALTQACHRDGIPIRYNSRAISLIREGVKIVGVRVRSGGETEEIRAGAVVLACGGFQSDAEWRARYLGPNWDLAKVRGTRFNSGDGIKMALAADAVPWGHWSGCHAVSWDMNAPAFGDLSVGDSFQKHSYPFGIVVNADGNRFLDEGADFRNYTYAKYGHIILDQPGQFAWQVFDAKVLHLLRDEYRIRQVTKVKADSLEELARKLEGVDAEAFQATVAEYNASIDQGIKFNPNIKDGRTTRDLAVRKSNWANTLDQPPFEAYAVTCGITFTFGGLRIDTSSQVIDSDGIPIPGLYACGELVGGIFYFNYPGGTGLTSGAVFGHIAGASAAASTGAVPAPAADPEQDSQTRPELSSEAR
jgi:tricarballylate dehydrogenase